LRLDSAARFRVRFAHLSTEGNTLGVQTAVLEGDPSKPGFYLTINKWTPEKTVGLKPGDYMRRTLATTGEQQCGTE
jgi:hypothetical protein